MKRIDEAGFTLLEMIVSLTILAGIAAFLVVAFRLAGGSIERGEAEAREMARLRAGIGIFERSVRSADASPLPEGREGPAPYFRGEAKRLRFLTSVGGSSFSAGGYRLLSFFEGERASDGGGLSVSDASPFRTEGVEAWEGTENSRVFLPGAKDVTFSYSPGPSDEGKWEWVDSWEVKEKGTLPRAVRVEFTTGSQAGPLRNAFVVPLMAGGA